MAALAVILQDWQNVLIKGRRRGAGMRFGGWRLPSRCRQEGDCCDEKSEDSYGRGNSDVNAQTGHLDQSRTKAAPEPDHSVPFEKMLNSSLHVCA